ncbi:MAG: serine/threonine protein kinase, partial [Deltaproteobacteria bacterium]|nr:serine/threonine protein kinase [Deltaproteobacteria bacterium]
MTRQIRIAPTLEDEKSTAPPPPPDDPAEALIGRLVAGRYRAEKILGRGGMGVVFEGTHVELEKKVAIKILLASYARDAEALTRFEREARNAAKLGHVNIAATLDLGRLDTGEPFLVMEHVAGTDLVSLVGSVARGEASSDRIVRILEQIAAALDVVHRAGIVHRDVKAENVLLTQGPDGEDVVKLVDFGLATLADAERKGARLTRAGMVIGTPEYIAPECARGASGGPQSDQYSLAVLAFEMFWGAPPFHGLNPMDILMQKVSEDAPLLSKISGRPGAALDAALARGLDRDPTARFDTCAELVAAIRAGVHEQTHAPVVPSNPPPRKPARSDRMRRPPTKDEIEAGEDAPAPVVAAAAQAQSADPSPSRSETANAALPISPLGRWLAIAAVLLLLLGVGVAGVTWGGGG